MRCHLIKRIFVLAALMLLAVCSNALAEVPYKTMTVGPDDTLVETQTAYDPVRFMNSFDGTNLKKPEDMKLGPDGNLYISDTGNKRIVVVSPDGHLVKTIGSKKELTKPTGLFVDDQLNVYVADETKGKVIVFDADGNVIQTYEKPEHPLFGENAYFRPGKISVDKRGNLYIASQGNSGGIIRISSEGEFLGYYGANLTHVSVLTTIKSIFYSDEQFNSMVVGRVPVSIDNLCMDEKGVVYTTSKLQSGGQSLRRLNMAGNNTLKVQISISAPAALTVSPNGSIFVSDEDNVIYEFTDDGKLLYSMMTTVHTTARQGLFKSVSAIAVDENDTLFVLDKLQGSIQVLKPTEFANTVHNALRSLDDGQYQQSKEYWLKVKRMNGLFAYADVGIGEAYYRDEQYQEAMQVFREAGDKEGYSDAFWEVRADWLHENLKYVLIGLLALLVLSIVIRILKKKTSIFKPLRSLSEKLMKCKYVNQLSYSFRILTHPNDTCYGIKRENKGSILSATVFLILFFIVYVFNKYYSGFLFKTVADGTYQIGLDAEVVFVVFLVVTVCTYLVCTVKEGEATLKDLYIGFSYSLIPYIIFTAVATVLSNGLTNNEAFLITLLNTISVVWTGALLFMTLMFLNDFKFGKTVVILIWTVFTILVLTAVVFIGIVLINQLADFIKTIIGEAVHRYA